MQEYPWALALQLFCTFLTFAFNCCHQNHVSALSSLAQPHFLPIPSPFFKNPAIKVKRDLKYCIVENMKKETKMKDNWASPLYYNIVILQT